MRYLLFPLLLIIVNLSVIPVHAQDTDECPSLAPLQLISGGQGRVIPGDAPNRVRYLPSISEQVLFQMAGGTVFDVLDGPKCADGYRWWRIRYQNQEGWTAEGSDSEYFLELVTSNSGEISMTLTPMPTSEIPFCSLEARLISGREGRVISSTPNRLRSAAGIHSEQIGMLEPQTIVKILSGPECNDGINWWLVSVGTIQGWTAEAVEGEYLIEIIELPPTAVPVYSEPPVAPNGIAWNSDGSLLAVSTERNGIFLYNTSDWWERPTHILTESKIQSFAFVPNHPNLIAVSSWPKRKDECKEPSALKNGLFIYDLNTSTISLMIRDFTGDCEPEQISELQFSVDGAILSTKEDGNLLSYVLPTGESKYHIDFEDFSDPYVFFERTAISADGTRYAMIHSEGVLTMFTADSSNDQRSMFEDTRVTQWVTALALSPDANTIIIGDEIGNLRTYTWSEDTESYSDYKSFIRGQRSTTSNRINALTLDPNGMIITAESDPYAVVRVFEPQTLAQIGNYFAGSSFKAAIDLDFNPDGSLLAVLVDGDVHLIDTSDYTLIRKLWAHRHIQ